MSNYPHHVLYYPDLNAAGNDFDEYDATPSANSSSATTATATSVSYSSSSDPNMVLTGVLMGIVVSFTLILCYLTVPAAVQWLRRRVIAVSPARLQRRYETIEGWLISKRVRAHCDTCEQLQAQFGCSKKKTKLPLIEVAVSYDTAETVLEEAGRECPVCMECFVENDIVSWSPSAQCYHVFHHSCIKQWLLHHECCPYCRLTVLPVDASAASADPVTAPPAKKWTVPELTELAQQRCQYSMITYYCLEEGLVTLDRPPVAASGKDAEGGGCGGCGGCDAVSNCKTGLPGLAKMKRFLSPDVRQGELAELRGSKSCGGGADAAGEEEEGAIVVVSVAATSDEGNAATTSGSRSTPEALHFANAVVDIETCMTQLRLISNGHEDDEEDGDSSPR